MKKFFLIPLLTLLTCVMAWAGIYNQVPDPAGVLGNDPHKASIRKAVMEDDPVEATNEAKIGSVEYATLQEAFDAATNGDVVELLADVNTGFWLAAEVDDKSLTIKGNGFKIQGCLILANETNSPMEITFDGVSINSTSWVMYAIGDIDIVLNAGSSNSLVSSKNYGIFGYGNSGDVNISGQGTLTSSISYMFYQCANVQIEAPNATFSTTSSSFGMQTTNIVLEAGSYGFNPASYVDFTSYIVTKPSSLYIVSAPAADVVAYNQNKLATYASLSAAVEDASAADVIYLYKNDASAVTVAKNITIKTNGHSTNLSAGADYSRADMGQNVVFTDNAIAAFLMADGTASLTVSEDANIASAGAIHVNGTKTLTINADVTVTYKRQGDLANIVVDNGAKLTVLGSGTFAPQMHSETRTIDGFTAEISATASNQIGNRAIDVDGELIVGVKDDPNNCPHFITSSLSRGSAVMVNATGVATFNNADMKVASMSIKNYGDVTINGGEYKSIATSQNGINGGWYAYHLNNEGVMTVNDGHFVGVQGAFSNTTANAIVTINGGSFETVTGHNWATGAANAKDNFYALYVACYSVVNVYGGYYKVQTPSLGGNKVIEIGNNDAYNTYGVVNLYGGHFQQKATVSARKNAKSSYPESIPSTSQWYGSFGSLAPLPAGYEYYDTGDATYPYGVRAVAGKEADAIDADQQAAQEADPTYTIPWQQATTWAADEVPAENTIVTIPVDATVTVSKAETVKEAVADQVYVAQGATLKVEEGTTLTVGDGGVNIGNGGKVLVESGAVVKIGAAGVITTENNALVLESTEDAQAVLLYNPAVKENTQPKATVKLTTKSKQLSKDPWIYTYQRFAIPVKEAMIPENDFAAKVAAATDEVFAPDAARVNYEFQSYVYYWDGANAKWANCKWTDLKPFYGYQLANNSTYGGVTYTFNGNLFGNEDKAFAFEAKGFEYFGNSYTAPIYIKSFLENLKEANPAVEATVWLYNYKNSQYGSVTLDQLSDPTVVAILGVSTEIKSMDAFVLRLRNANEGAAPVDYSSAIWSNPNVNPSAAVSSAPARNMRTSDSKIAAIEVADGNGNSDRVILMENEAYTNGFDNGADATKFMSKGGIDLYASTNEGELSCVAADDMNKTLISFKSGDATSYTLNFKAMNTDYMLRDNVANTVVAIEEGATYTFNQAANTTVPARFEIIAAAKVPTSIENVEAAAKASGIYSIAGQFLGNDFSVLPAGVYVVNGVKIVK